MIKELKINLKCREDEVRHLQSNELNVQKEKIISIKRHQKQLAETIYEIETINSKANALITEYRVEGKRTITTY